MDFIDYDTFGSDVQETALPEPAPPLILPLNAGITNKFKGSSLLQRKRLDFEPTTGVNATSKTAEKYAKISEALFQDHSSNGGLIDVPSKHKSLTEFMSQGPGKPDQVLTDKLANVLQSHGLNEAKLRNTLEILQQKQELDCATLIRSDILGAIQRRRFRSDIEGELLKQHSAVLREFLPVVEKVKHLGQQVERLTVLKEQLLEFGELDPQLLTEIKQLSKQKNVLLMKKSLLVSFKKRFTLTQFEEHFLTHENISLEYFQVLQKCKKIHSDCSILLTLQNQTLGVKIMEKMNKFLDLSYERISYFVGSKLEYLIDEGLTHGSRDLRLMKVAIFLLSSNLKYFDEVTSKLVQSRSKTIVDEFLYQSNTDSSGIVLSAHDPLRHIGDILAFVHSMIVNEVEFISALFQISDDEAEYERSDFEKSLIQLENLHDVNGSMTTIMEHVIGSLSRPLKIRLEQVVRGERDLPVIVKIFNLFDLYKMMFKRQLGGASQCTLLETLESLKSLCVERAVSVLKEKILTIEKESEAEGWKIDDDSFLPPDWLRDFYSDSLPAFNDAVNSEVKLMDMDENIYSGFMKQLIDKPIDLIFKQAKANFEGNQVNLKIFVINSLDLIESKVLVVPVLTAEVDKLALLISKTKEELIQRQYETLLKNSGLEIHQQLIQLIFPIEQIEMEDDYYMYSSLVENKLFQRERLQEIENQIHEFLPVALIDIQQDLFKISSPSIASDIITESSLKYLKLYKVFHKVLGLLYENEHLLEWSTRDVATLLGVEQLYEQV